MKKSRYTEGQIVKALKDEENSRSVIEISRELGINKQTFYNRMKKFAGVGSIKYQYARIVKSNNQQQFAMLINVQ